MLYTITSIAPLCQDLHSQGKSIVLATGFFDLLHKEHINFLHKARQEGDILIVAVESDSRARAVKGDSRPIEPQSLRCKKVEKYADFVIELGDDFNNQEAYESLMASVQPDIYAVSSHTDHLENKKTLTEKYGGELKVVHEFNPDISTTRLLATS